MGLLDSIRADTEMGFQTGEFGDGPPDLSHLSDDLVYEMLRDAEPIDEGDLAHETREGLGLQVAYGHSIFRLGHKLYFKWVEQSQTYRCTDRTVIWQNGGNYSFAGRSCSGSNRTIYQLTRLI
jgi:hypothetical protein